MSSNQERLRQFTRNLAETDLVPAADAKSQPPYPGSTWADLAQARDPIQWDWPRWLPRGFLVILASAPGVGKSSLCLRTAAAYIDGRPWPDGAPFTAQRGKLLWCESEGGHDMNLERALNWGLDPAQIINPLANSIDNFKLDNPLHLKNLLLHASRADVRLVVLDSLSGLHARADSPRATREMVTSLANIARATCKPILLTHHLRKRTTFDRNGHLTIDRLLGSSVISQVPRVIWALDVPDLADPDNRRLMVIKNNLAPLPQPIGLRIDAQGLHFGPPPQALTAYAALDRTADFLKDLLANGPLPANQVKAQAQAAGFSASTIKRAKKRLRIKSNKLPGEWYWELSP